MPRVGTARVFVAAALLTVAACAVGQDVTSPGISASPVVPTTSATVDHVVDGDTAWFRLADGTKEKVRFIGVDTPESTTEHEPFGKEAAAYTASILTPGRGVELQTDLDARDRYGRLLAYVWLSPPATGASLEARQAMLNAMLVRDGYATVLTVPPNIAYVELFLALQREARDAAKGLWSLSS